MNKQDIIMVEKYDIKYDVMIKNTLYYLYKLNNKIYKNFDINKVENFCELVPPKIFDYIKYVEDPTNRAVPNVINVLEIGFFAGHSAVAFLSANDNVRLTSFDIGIHKYLKIGKKFIDKHFKKRHTMIIGNSIETVAKYKINNKNKKFDIILIDGNDNFDYVMGDIFNCNLLAHPKTIVILNNKKDNNNDNNKNPINNLVALNKINIKKVHHYNNISEMTVFTYV